MGKYAEHNDLRIVGEAINLCRGSYQENIINGHEAISGATLKGKAKRYGDKYKRSAASLLTRCKKAGLNVRVETRKYGKLVVVVG